MCLPYQSSSTPFSVPCRIADCVLRQVESTEGGLRIEKDSLLRCMQRRMRPALTPACLGTMHSHTLSPPHQPVGLTGGCLQNWLQHSQALQALLLPLLGGHKLAACNHLSYKYRATTGASSVA